MRADQRRLGDMRTTVLVPEAIIPQQSERAPRWGLGIATLLLGMAAGIAFAWSLGVFRPNTAEQTTPLAAEASLPPATPRSPYPTELPDLSGRTAAVPEIALLPVAPPEPMPKPPPVAVEPPALRPRPEPRLVAPSPTARTARPHAVIAAPVVARPIVARPVVAPPVAAPPRAQRPASLSTSSLPTSRRGATLASHIARSLSGPLGGLVGQGDYPAASRRAGEQGDVTVRLAVATDGRVSRCAMLASNASRVLEATTCGVLTRRARFAPATDSNGAAISDAVIVHIAWRLP